ncbi:MAG: aminoacyl-tRNA hydrolase [Pseudomonadota bacterium]
MTLLVGLGNPGARYARNRHNIGFMALDAIVQRHGLPDWRDKFSGAFSEGRIGSGKCRCFKPMTYMNESGNAVSQACQFFKIPPKEVVVFYDELDLAPLKVRVKAGGGAAGHNGIRSIAAHIGPDFRRVRLGIGHPGHKALVQKHVLGDFAKADEDWLRPLLDALADHAGLIADGEDSTFMNKVHLSLQALDDDEDTRPPEAPKKGQPSPSSKRNTPVTHEKRDGPLAGALRGLFKR